MPVTSADLTVGPTDLYIAVFTEALAVEPVTPTTAPAASWLFLGATDGGVKLTVAQKFEQQYVDQVADPLESSIDTRMATAEFSLTRVTLDALKQLMNGGTITTSGTGPATVNKFEPVVDLVANDPVYTKVMLRGKAPADSSGVKQHRDIHLRRTLQVDDLGYNTGKTDKSVFTASLTAHYVSSSIAPFAWIDSAPA